MRYRLPPDFYAKLARRLHISPGLAKRTLYLCAYGGATDPWLKHLVLTETCNLVRESLYADSRS